MRQKFYTDPFFLGHVVYEVMVQNQSFYIGLCEMKNIGRMPDAFKNSEFKRIIYTMSEFELEILHVGRDLKHCETLRDFHALTKRSHCNENGTVLFENVKVICLDNNARFSSVKEAAEYAGCTPDSMSKHLANRKGYGTIKGLRYDKI